MHLITPYLSVRVGRCNPRVPWAISSSPECVKEVAFFYDAVALDNRRVALGLFDVDFAHTPHARYADLAVRCDT
jgi:hypothetical protein